MIVDGHCRACGRYFDAHWHGYPAMTSPYCPYCKSDDVRITTDEDNNSEIDELDDPCEED